MLAMFLSALDGTIVATALPTIGRDLGDPAHLPWVVTAYLIAATAATPLYGKLADIHGRRPVMLAAVGLFVLGSLACALAPSVALLAAARGLQGLGGGGLLALAQTIIGDMVAPRDRGRYQAWFGGVFAVASVLGPVLGGFFAESLHWTLIFWINGPLGFLAFLLVSERLKRLPAHHRPHRLDLAGAALMTAATVSLTLALSWGGVAFPWTSAPVLGLFALSAAFWGLFAVRMLTAPEPLIPLAVLRHPVVAAATVAGGLTTGVYVGLSIFTPLFFETRLGLSARESGFALIPFMFGVPLGATASGRAMGRLARYKRPPLVGLAVATGALAAFAASAAAAPLWAALLLLGVAAIGLGTVLPVATVATQNAVEPHHLGTATAGMNFVRQLAGAVIVALFGAVALGGGPVEAGPRSPGTIGAGPFSIVFFLAAGGLAAAWAALALMAELPLRDRPSDGARG